MKKLSVANIGSQGINSDVAPWDLDYSFLTYGVNFRVYSNYIETAGGYEEWGQIPEAIDAGFIVFAGDSTNPYWLIAGRSKVYSFNGSAYYDVTNTGFTTLPDGAELEWSSCMLGKIPILNNYQGYPVYWEPPSGSQLLVPLPFDATDSWEDKGYKARVMRSYKNYLFALGVQEGATEFSDVYRWSHPADINGLPFTWDETDPSSLAGRASIGGDFGPIIDGLTLRDSFVIYSESGINVLTESNDEFIFSRRPLVTSVGLIAPNCLVEVMGRHLFIGDGDILVNDGNSVESLIHGRIQKQFNSRINSEFYFRSFAVRNTADKEVWFCVPTEDSEHPNLAYIYNWKEGSWAMRDLPENLAFANYGPKGTPLPTWDTWAGTWEEQNSPWGSPKKTPLDGTVVGVTTAGGIILLDPTGPREGGSLNTVIERTDMSIEGLDNVNTIVRVYPHIAGTSEVIIEFGSQKLAGGPVTWKTEKRFRPGVDRKIDIRTTGSLHAWRIKSAVLGNWAFSGMDIEYEQSGKR